ncbi:uncharacterized protein EV420DRAFT_1708683, partial [Desarmillaria tabescens]
GVDKGISSQLADQSLRLQPHKGARTCCVLSVCCNVRTYMKDLVKSASTWECNLGKIVGKSPVKYSDGSRKHMDMQSQFEAGQEDGDQFQSLTDLKWGEFKLLGFGGLGQEKLQFDLNESARTAQSTKRQMLSWNDFSSIGFTRSDITPFTEYAKKLKEAAKHIPAFGWDTESAAISEIGKAERECNWALIEFQSDTLLLLEEFVPLEYHQQMSSSSSGSSRRCLPSLFSPTSTSPNMTTQSKKDKTEQSKSKVLSPKASFREVEFEGLLRGDGNWKMKVITLGSKETHTTMIGSPTEVEPPPITIGGTPPNRCQFCLGGSGTPTNDGSVMGQKLLIDGLPPAEYSSMDFETRLASLNGEDVYEDYLPVDGILKKCGLLMTCGWTSWWGVENGAWLARMQKALKGVRKMSQSPESQQMEKVPVRDEEEESIEVERVPSRLAMNDFVNNPWHPQCYDDWLDCNADGPSMTEQSIQSLHYDQHKSEDDEPEPVVEAEEEKEESPPQPDPQARFGHDSDSEDELLGPGIQLLPRVLPIINLDDQPSPSTVPLKVPNKTAALIEIYQEWEHNSTSQATPRVLLMPKIVMILAQEEAEEGEEEVVPPPLPCISVIDKDQGHASLGWYVHGTPLHNVLEEEEEE